jgi:hypothetical protein
VRIDSEVCALLSGSSQPQGKTLPKSEAESCPKGMALSRSFRLFAYSTFAFDGSQGLSRHCEEQKTGASSDDFGRSAVNAASPYLGIGSVRLERISFAFMCRECVWVGVLR